MKKCHVIAVISLLLMASNSFGNVTFKVVKVQGVFWYWSIRAGDWSPITESLELAPETLIQTLSPGNLRLSQSQSDGSIHEFSLISHSRLICRLKDGIIRNLSVSKLYMKDLSRELGKKSDDKLNLATAWKRNHILYSSLAKTRNGSGKAVSKGSNVKNSKNSTVKMDGKVHLIHPKSGSVLFVDHFPATIAIVWDDHGIDQQSESHIFVGLENIEDSLPLVATTRESHVTIPVDEEGSYQLGLAKDPKSPPQILGTFYVIFTAQTSLPSLKVP